VLAQAAGRAGHIFNLGHGIVPGTPVENVQAVVRMVKALSPQFSVKKIQVGPEGGLEPGGSLGGSLGGVKHG